MAWPRSTWVSVKTVTNPCGSSLRWPTPCSWPPLRACWARSSPTQMHADHCCCPHWRARPRWNRGGCRSRSARPWPSIAPAPPAERLSRGSVLGRVLGLVLRGPHPQGSVVALLRGEDEDLGVVIRVMMGGTHEGDDLPVELLLDHLSEAIVHRLLHFRSQIHHRSRAPILDQSALGRRVATAQQHHDQIARVVGTRLRGALAIALLQQPHDPP